MTQTDAHVRSERAHLAAVIERAAADLAIGEEPAGLIVALEQGADNGGEST